MIFSYVQNPRYKKIKIQFITGKEEAMRHRDYKVGDYLPEYYETDILLVEYKNRYGEWLQYWIAVREGQIVGVELKNDKENKFDIAVKYGLTWNYKILSDTKKIVKKSIIKKR